MAKFVINNRTGALKLLNEFSISHFLLIILHMAGTLGIRIDQSVFSRGKDCVAMTSTVVGKNWTWATLYQVFTQALNFAPKLGSSSPATHSSLECR